MGRFAGPSLSSLPSANDVPPVDLPIVGSRCQIQDGDDLPCRQGTVRFVGQTSFGKQDGLFWVGIELDDPMGRNDGS